MTQDQREPARLRAVEGYEPRFDLDLAYGQQGEMLVSDVAEAIRNGMVEVKRDAVWRRTGNLYVEYECRRASGAYEKSGIATSNATLWAFVLGDTEVMLVVPTELVAEFGRNRLRRSAIYKLEERNGSHPTRGFKLRPAEFFDWLQQKVWALR